MSQLYRRHQSRGLRPKQVTLIRQRCPVTGQLLGPNEGNAVVVEHLDRNGKPNGVRTGVRIAKMSLGQHFTWMSYRQAHSLQLV